MIGRQRQASATSSAALKDAMAPGELQRKPASSRSFLKGNPKTVSLGQNMFQGLLPAVYVIVPSTQPWSKHDATMQDFTTDMKAPEMKAAYQAT